MRFWRRLECSLCVLYQSMSNVGMRGADAVVGLQVHALVLDAAPEPFDEHVIAPGAAAVSPPGVRIVVASADLADG